VLFLDKRLYAPAITDCQNDCYRSGARLHADITEPFAQGFSPELSAIVAANMIRNAALDHQVTENGKHILIAQTVFYLDRQALLGLFRKWVSKNKAGQFHKLITSEMHYYETRSLFVWIYIPFTDDIAKYPNTRGVCCESPSCE